MMAVREEQRMGDYAVEYVRRRYAEHPIVKTLHTQMRDNFTPEQAIICAQVVELCPEGNRGAARRSQAVVLNLILDQEWHDLRFVLNHADLIQNQEFTLPYMIMLVSTLRYLDIIDDKAECYPHLAAHAMFSRRFALDNTPYHHLDGMVQLVHDYHDRSDEVYRLMTELGTNDSQFLRLHLENQSKSLTSGLL